MAVTSGKRAKREERERERKQKQKEKEGREREREERIYSAGTCTRLKRFAAEKFRRAASWFIKAEPAVVIRI